MSITLTLIYESPEEIADAVRKMSAAFSPAARAAEPTGAQIAHEDRPDVGAPAVEPPAPPAVNPFAAPEAAAVPVPPAPPAAPVAPASPAPSEHSAATAPTDAPVSGVVLDSKGLPWDGRIHGSTKSLNTDGSWRQKRGLNDDALKVRVEAELRAAMSARAPTTAVVPPTPPATAAALGATLPPAEAPAAPVPPSPPPAAPAGPETFGQLMARIAPRMGSDPTYAEKLNETLAKFGLMSLAGLASRGDLVAPFAAMLDEVTAV